MMPTQMSLKSEILPVVGITLIFFVLISDFPYIDCHRKGNSLEMNVFSMRLILKFIYLFGM